MANGSIINDNILIMTLLMNSSLENEFGDKNEFGDSSKSVAKIFDS